MMSTPASRYIYSAICAALLVLAGCQVRAPGAIETSFIDGAKRRITVGGSSDEAPLPGPAKNIPAGQRNSPSYCMVCHGLDGHNPGGPFGDKMSPPVPLLN